MATRGIAAAEQRKIALSWALFMAVPVRATPEEWAKPATANINLALAHHLILGTAALALAQVTILTPAPVPAMQVVWAPLVVASMRLVPAPAVMSGKMVVAGNMEQLASCIIAMAKLLVYVLQVWASMSQ